MSSAAFEQRNPHKGSPVGYGSDDILATVQASSPDFEGLAGLPLLRLMEYGGDADSFWVRPLPPKP